jgi:hypothetical protein
MVKIFFKIISRYKHLKYITIFYVNFLRLKRRKIMEKTTLNSSTPNFEYEVIKRKYQSSRGRVLIKCETEEKANKLYSTVLKKHLSFCIFERVKCVKHFAIVIHQAYHNVGYRKKKITEVLDKIKIGEITKDSPAINYEKDYESKMFNY